MGGKVYTFPVGVHILTLLMEKNGSFLTLVYMVRQSLFRGTMVTDTGATKMAFCCEGEIGLSSEYNKETWTFIAKERN